MLHWTATPHVVVLLGTRPEAIKLAPVVFALRSLPGLRCDLVTTGQQASPVRDILQEFGLTPDHDLAAMPSDPTLHGLSAGILTRLVPWLNRRQPDWLLVQGDTTSAFAGALAGFQAGIRVAHVEAGLRTHDRGAPWPEEMHRSLIARLAELHFAPTEAARRNLLLEGVPAGSIQVTGNTAIDALLFAAPSQTAAPRDIILVTGHRQEARAIGLGLVGSALRRLARRPGLDIRVVLHANPAASGPLRAALADTPGIMLLPPQGYRAFTALMARARMIITDSGGIQEEAPSLGVPVLLTRDETDRPEAEAAGAVRLVGRDGGRLVAAAEELLDNPAQHAAMAAAGNPYGDGRAAQRIAKALQHATSPLPMEV